MAVLPSLCVACSAPVDWPQRFGSFLNGSPLSDADHAGLVFALVFGGGAVVMMGALLWSIWSFVKGGR